MPPLEVLGSPLESLGSPLEVQGPLLHALDSVLGVLRSIFEVSGVHLRNLDIDFSWLSLLGLSHIRPRREREAITINLMIRPLILIGMRLCLVQVSAFDA